MEKSKKVKKNSYIIKKFKKYCTLEIFIIILFASKNVFAANNANDYPEFVKVLNFISFLIGLIRFSASTVAGLIATVTGWNIMTNSHGNGMETAKKIFNNALTGLVIIFFGSTFAKFMVDKAAKFLIG